MFFFLIINNNEPYCHVCSQSFFYLFHNYIQFVIFNHFRYIIFLAFFSFFLTCSTVIFNFFFILLDWLWLALKVGKYSACVDLYKQNIHVVFCKYSPLNTHQHSNLHILHLGLVQYVCTFDFDLGHRSLCPEIHAANVLCSLS